LLTGGAFCSTNRSAVHTTSTTTGNIQQPPAVAAAPPARRLLDLLGPLDWTHLPERDLQRNWGHATVPHAAFIAACLVKINEGKVSMAQLLDYLTDHPQVTWLCGLPGLPTGRHLTRMLRELPNELLQFLLSDTIRLIQCELNARHVHSGDVVAVDTKHIIAWVKQNNPKAYVSERYDKNQQPKGDPDCRLGCKRRHNQSDRQSTAAANPPTPTTNPAPAKGLKVGEFYWGYASGLAVAPAPGYGEFVLAELTQPFDQPDVSYFFPLMRQVESRLGRKPRFGALDAAFDAWYVHAYFYNPDDPDAFAAVPFVEKGGYKEGERHFSPDNLPLCSAGLPMPLLFTFSNRSKAIFTADGAPAQWGKYGCPLLHPHLSQLHATCDTTTPAEPELAEPELAESELAESKPAACPSCPINHDRFAQGGCTAQMPTSIGARLRYTLDRHSDHYQRLYDQRSAVERINSQAVALGIERPHIRNRQAIANLNTLTYILINLRFLQRLRLR